MEYYVIINYFWLIRGDMFIFLFFILYLLYFCYFKFFIWNFLYVNKFLRKDVFNWVEFCNNVVFYFYWEYLILYFIVIVFVLCFKIFFDKYIFIRKKLFWVEIIFYVCKSWFRCGSNIWIDYIWMIIVLLVNCWKVL